MDIAPPSTLLMRVGSKLKILEKLAGIRCKVMVSDEPGWEGAKLHFHGWKMGYVYLETPYGAYHRIRLEVKGMGERVLEAKGWMEAVQVIRGG